MALCCVNSFILPLATLGVLFYSFIIIIIIIYIVGFRNYIYGEKSYPPKMQICT